MRRRLPWVFLIFFVGFGLGIPHANAALQASDPAGLINTLVDSALTVIKDPSETEAQRQEKFRSLLEQGFDIPRIARFVLGRYWNGATDQERQRFTSLFENWIVSTYSSRFSSYTGQTIKIIGTRQESNVSTVVESEFIDPNGAPPAKIEWRVLKRPDGSYKIVDVAVEGVSMALTQRDEIATVADRSGGTIAGLNNALEQRIASGEPAPGAVPPEGASH